MAKKEEESSSPMKIGKVRPTSQPATVVVPDGSSLVWGLFRNIDIGDHM